MPVPLPVPVPEKLAMNDSIVDGFLVTQRRREHRVYTQRTGWSGQDRSCFLTKNKKLHHCHFERGKKAVSVLCRRLLNTDTDSFDKLKMQMRAFLFFIRKTGPILPAFRRILTAQPILTILFSLCKLCVLCGSALRKKQSTIMSFIASFSGKGTGTGL